MRDVERCMSAEVVYSPAAMGPLSAENAAVQDEQTAFWRGETVCKVVYEQAMARNRRTATVAHGRHLVKRCNLWGEAAWNLLKGTHNSGQEIYIVTTDSNL